MFIYVEKVYYFKFFFKGFSVDWWVFGVFMFEMMAGRFSFDIVGSFDNFD